MAGVIPGVELTPGLACVPVVNVVLAFRALLQGQRAAAGVRDHGAARCSSCAAIAVWIAMRALSRELVAAATAS